MFRIHIQMIIVIKEIKGFPVINYPNQNNLLTTIKRNLT